MTKDWPGYDSMPDHLQDLTRKQGVPGLPKQPKAKSKLRSAVDWVVRKWKGLRK